MAKQGKKPEYLSIDEWTEKAVVYVDIHTHTMECYSAIKKSKVLSFCDSTSYGYYAKRNKSVRERQIPYDFIYMWNLKNNINDQTKQKYKHR